MTLADSMVQDYTTIDNKDGALSEGSRRLSDDDTESGCNSTVAARSFIVNSDGDWHVGEGSGDYCNLVVIVQQRYL